MKNYLTHKQYLAWHVAVVIALLFGAYFLRGYITIIMVSIIIAFIFNPLYQRILKKVKSPGTAASLTFLISLIIIIIPLLLIGLVAIIQIKELLNTLSHESFDFGSAGQSALASVNDILRHIPGAPQLTTSDVTTWANHAVSTIANRLLSFLTSSIGNISKIITSLIIYIYLFVNILMHQKVLLSALKRLNPLGVATTNLYLHRMGAMTMAMGKGQFVIAFLQGLESSIVLYFVGFHSLFLFFLIVLSFLSIIPLGAGIITIPLGIVMMLTGNITGGLIVLLNHFLIVTNIDNVVRPRLVPKDAHLNSALTILSVFAGVAMFGFPGIIIGPVLMILIVSTISSYMEIPQKEVPEPVVVKEAIET